MLVPHKQVYLEPLKNVFSLPKNGKTLRFRNKQRLSKKISELEKLTFGICCPSKPEWDETWSCFKQGQTVGNTAYALFDRYGLHENHVIRDDYQKYFEANKHV